MNALNMTAIVLIVLGTLGLAYGSFSYDTNTDTATLGPIKLSVTERETINVPIWAGVGAIAIGGLLLVVGSRRGG
jgi:hypothetical protein